ncbi:MAG: single-stranded DNA-binding protein [Firmicutes bacterium]|jgi:hypothetical protein|nr:single-stranded DNA-binding protein [Bacillota bacterium]
MNTVHLFGEVCTPVKIEVVKTKAGPLKKAKVTLKVICPNGKPEAIPVTAWDRAAERLAAAQLRPGQYVLVEGRLHVTLGSDDNAAQLSVLQVFLTNFTSVVPKAS